MTECVNDKSIKQSVFWGEAPRFIFSDFKFSSVPWSLLPGDGWFQIFASRKTFVQQVTIEHSSVQFPWSFPFVADAGRELWGMVGGEAGDRSGVGGAIWHLHRHAACTHHDHDDADHDDQYYQINIASSLKHQYEYCQSETLGPSGPD